MPITTGGLKVSEVIDECRNIYLNDSGAQLYTDNVMLPYVRTAYQELEDRLVNAGIQYVHEESSVIDISAGTKTPASPPADMIMPVWLGERPDGSTELFTPMINTSWPPNISPSESLIYWIWEEGAIKFLGATTNREIMIRYHKALGELASTSTVILVPNSKNYLAQKASALAAQFIGGNTELSMNLESRANLSKDLLFGACVKERQGRGVRARPFRSFRTRR